MHDGGYGCAWGTDAMLFVLHRDGCTGEVECVDWVEGTDVTCDWYADVFVSFYGSKLGCRYDEPGTNISYVG